MKLLSWNVLADSYIRPEYYPATPAAMLAPGARTAAIVERLAASDADVICIQEVEEPLFEAARAALSGDFPFARFAKKGAGKPDGCATFVRAVLAVESASHLHYIDGEPPSGHVALMTLVREGEKRAAIANTHLKWDPPDAPRPERWAPKQATALLDAIGSDVPWILCGDFNFTQDDPVLATLFARGFVDTYAWPRSQPTTNTAKRAKRIDYILVQPPLAAEPHPLREIDAATPLPGPGEPSDHLAIAASIGWSR